MGVVDRLLGRTDRRLALTASARRIDLGDRMEATRIRTSRQQWQEDAWAYRDAIPEIRFAVGFLRNAARRVRLVPGWINAEGRVIPLDEAVGNEPGANVAALAAANDALARLSGDSGSHADLLEPYAENLEVPGEGWIVGFLDPDTRVERWEFRSMDEVAKDAAGVIRLLDDPSEGMMSSAYAGMELPPDAWLVRVWQPHPRYRGQPDSPMRSLLEPCEELLLASRSSRGAFRNRLAANGVVLIGQSVDVIGADVDPETGQREDLQTSLTKASIATLSSEGDARSVVPIFATVPDEAVDKIKHLTFDRPLDGKDLEVVEKAIRRLAQGLDVPPEIVLGLADVNHWTAWQIDEGAFKNHIAPLVERMVDGVTAGVYRPLLAEAYGIPPETVRRMVCWYDPSAITVKPNRTQDAKDAHGSLAISDATYLEVLGFDPDTDAPSDEEVARRIAAQRGSIDPRMMDWLLQAYFDARYPGLREVPPGQVSVPVGETAQEAEAANPPAAVVVPGQIAPAAPPTGPDQPTEPPPPAPAPPPSQDGPPPPAQQAVAASAARRVTARRLVNIERSLRDRLQAAADEAVFRSLERAGNRLRSRAAKSPVLKAEIDKVPAHLIGLKLGRERAATLATDAEILQATFDRLSEQYGVWTRAAAREALREAARIAGRTLTADEIDGGLAALDGDIDAGWTFMQSALTAVAHQALFALANEPDVGEGRMAHYVDPGIIRGALTVAGGMPPTAEGVTIEGTAVIPGSSVGGLTGGLWLDEFMVASDVGVSGYEWVYGISQRHFEPHLALDGIEFRNYGDAVLANPLGWPADTCAPGDHKGCHCDAAQIYETGQRASRIQETVGNASYDPSQMQVIRDIAAQDEAAGRYGWPSTSAIDTAAQADRIAASRPSQQE